MENVKWGHATTAQRQQQKQQQLQLQLTLWGLTYVHESVD